MLEMVMAALLSGSGASFVPLRTIGALGLDKTARDPATSLVAAGRVGLAIHMVRAMMYGVAIAAVLGLIPAVSSTRTSVLTAPAAAATLSDRARSLGERIGQMIQALNSSASTSTGPAPSSPRT
jgi:hypothetical protein